MGQVDIEDLVEKNLKDVSDWERNFKMLKSKGREAEKLPKYFSFRIIHRNKIVLNEIILFHLIYLKCNKSRLLYSFDGTNKILN